MACGVFHLTKKREVHWQPLIFCETGYEEEGYCQPIAADLKKSPEPSSYSAGEAGIDLVTTFHTGNPNTLYSLCYYKIWNIIVET